MATVKRYPFSMRRYGHNIELAYNHLYCAVMDMQDGTKPWNQDTYDSFQRLSDLYANAIGHPVYMATGKEYGMLQEYSTWAECYRDRRNARN